MKHLFLGSGRFGNITHSTIKHFKRPTNVIVGGGNAGHGGYVKKDLSMENEGKTGTGVITKKLKPLKFKM
jgi:hypothetical protein